MTRKPQEPQIVSVWFPDLTFERWKRVISAYRTAPDSDVPVVLSREDTHGPVVYSINQAAKERGVSIGERVVDAQAIHPDLHVESADLDGDQALMQRLVYWCRRWCPWTAQDGVDGLYMDVTGAAHLFGGEARMLHDMVQRFALQGLTARLAMAPTPGAAQALARYGAQYQITARQDLTSALSSLPVAALRLTLDMVRLLNRLGLKEIGALAAVPRAALMQRFSAIPPDRNPLMLMDRAFGASPDPLNAPPDHIQFIVRARLAEPVIDPAPHLKGLVEDLCHDLADAEQGARHLCLTIYRIDSEWRTVQLATAASSRDPAHLLRLFDGKLDGIDPGFGFDLLTLEAIQVEPLSRIQQSLDGKRDVQADIAGLVDRLTARLGRDNITWSTWRESHIPERMEGRVPALQGEPSDAPELPHERPIRIVDPPEEVRVIYAVPEGPPSQFRWRGVLYKSTRHAGPERIAPEWWRDRPGTRLRDYYKVEVQDGRRFWLYRQGVLHDGRGDDPRWFMHGFFA
jgi:protein ImuB